jgi:hypothetical protein
MKNIHLMPTDKPSRLYEFGDIWFSHKEPTECFRNYNIYITSDEEIKEGDKGWLLENNGITKNISQYDCTKGLGGIYPTDKKIILTTDKELIADGVQAIDDDFLEWFVKNPSCEFVKVNPFCEKLTCQNESCNVCCQELKYKISTPKETLSYTEAAKKDERIFNSTMMKQETIEEDASDYAYNNHDLLDVSHHKGLKQGFIDGANYQAKRMYSEEEVKDMMFEILNTKREECCVTHTKDSIIRKVFEQFKKK